jgi:two-component system response regulator HydG
VAPGSGQITRTACRAGADVLFTFSAGVYRTAGVGSLASFLANGNANDQTEELLRRQILPHCGETPVVAGQMPGDPLFTVEERLDRLKALGVEAITNWPATGLADGSMREIMAAEGISHQTERDMLAVAKDRGFAVFGFALSAEDVRSFCALGVDGLILNVGLTRAVQDSLEKKNQIRSAITTAREMWRALESVEPEPLCFLFGGSIIQPLDLEEILRELPIHGYAGGSAFERIPVQAIVDSTVRRLKGVLRPSAGKEEIDALPGRGDLLGSSRQMMEIYDLIDRVAPHDVNVLIEGETGTGKELVAHYLHRESPRRDMPFVTMNCGAIPESLVESEFFGYEKGAFTGAHDLRRGKFELANHGVLFLDEIGDLSSHGQVSLLRVIQQGEIFRIGGQSPIRVDVRILAATNKNLQEEVRRGSFRSDLYYRISTMVIKTPPLRQRPSDIPMLVRHVLKLLSTRLNRKLIGVTDAFMERLLRYPWPGNVRELEHVLTRAALLEDGAILEGKEVLLSANGSESTATFSTVPVEGESRGRLAREALRRCGNNKTRAAAELGISRKTFYQWLKTPES